MRFSSGAAGLGVAALAGLAQGEFKFDIVAAVPNGFHYTTNFESTGIADSNFLTHFSSQYRHNTRKRCT